MEYNIFRMPREEELTPLKLQKFMVIMNLYLIAFTARLKGHIGMITISIIRSRSRTTSPTTGFR